MIINNHLKSHIKRLTVKYIDYMTYKFDFVKMDKHYSIELEKYL